MDRPTAIATRQIDNELTIVTEWRFAAGAQTGWHKHEFDYTVVPGKTGSLSIESADGITESSLVAGESYFRRAGVEHNVINANDFEFVFVEIEYRKPLNDIQE